jgi:predicted kinase
LSGTLHLLIGPVGTGKSTWARRWSARRPTLFLDVDAFMVRLYGGDRRPDTDAVGWYLERRERVRGLVWDLARQALSGSSDVILELGLVSVREREQAYRTAAAEDLPLKVHLIDAPREVRRSRVAQRNLADGPHTQQVPPAFFELASDAWEAVTGAERAAWDIVDG